MATLTVNGTLSANVSLENNCIGAQTTNITVGESGALTAGGAIGIRNAGGSITVNGILNAKGIGSGEHSALLSKGEGTITVNKGAQLTANGVVCGINAGSNSIIINEGAQLTATGGTTGAITGTVKNAIAGTGWTDTEGTQGKAEIAVSETGQNLPSSYKKVQFPAKVDPKPTPKPTPKKSQTVGKTIIRNTIANSSKKSNDVIYDAVPGATGYDIAYKHKNSSKWIIKNVGKKTRATVSGFSVKGIYQFKVRAKKAETSKYKAATGSWSTVIYRYFHTTEKIRLKSASKGSFTMSWKKNPQATGYQVMFTTNKNGAGAAKNINTVGKNATSFTKTGLKSGRTYYVQVREIVKIGGVNYIGNISCPVPVKIR